MSICTRTSFRDNSGPGLEYFAQLRERTRQKHENPELPDRPATLNDLHLETYVREMWLDSDTKIAALSGAPSDIKKDWLLPNDTIANAREQINRLRRFPTHAVAFISHLASRGGWRRSIAASRR